LFRLYHLLVHAAAVSWEESTTPTSPPAQEEQIRRSLPDAQAFAGIGRPATFLLKFFEDGAGTRLIQE
jgi:hypothetical protein